MTIVWWAVIALYVAGAAKTFRPCARHVIHELAMGMLWWSDVILGSFIALLMSIVWPLVAVCYGFKSIAGDSAEAAAMFIGGETKAAKARRLYDESESRRLRIAELERELGYR